MKTLKPIIKTINTDVATTPMVKRDRGRRARKERERILIRDLYLCQICRTRKAEEVDHITPLFAGGTDDHTNKQSVCIPCHREKTENEAKQRVE